MPSGGLLDMPQDAYYYEWHLINPKDEPYAKFKFHYRTWDNLAALQLIPPSHPRTLLPPTTSLLALNKQAHNLQDDEGDWETDVDDTSLQKANSPSSSHSSPATTPWISKIVDDGPKIARALIDKETPFPALHRTIASNIPVMTEKVSQLSLDNTEQKLSIEADQDYAHHRPLPEVPARNTSVKSRESSRSTGHSRSSSRASRLSNPVPIISSLRSYFNKDNKDPDSPEIEIGIARGVHIPKPVKAREISIIEDLPSLSSLDADLDPFTDASTPIEEDFHQKDFISTPEDDLPLTPNVTVRKHRRTQARERFSKIPDNDPNRTPISLTESEWMCRTPSPIKGHPDHVRVENLWSPGTEKAISPPPETKPLRRKALAWYKTVRTPDVDADQIRYGDEVKIRSGNWI